MAIPTANTMMMLNEEDKTFEVNEHEEFGHQQRKKAIAVTDEGDIEEYQFK
jgi:hypothetical protein